MHDTRACAGSGWLVVLVLVLMAAGLGGCGSTGPAPVYDWDWRGPVPEGFYLVRPGDTLGEIAARRGQRLRTLAEWNRLGPPYTIYAGTLLRVAPPAGAAARTQPPSRTVSEPRQAPQQRVQAAPKPVVARVDTSPAGAPGSRRAASGVDWEWPIDGPLVQDFRNADRTRQGIRIGGRAGLQVRAAAPGKVVYSGGGLKGYGNLIIVKHSEKYLSAYGFNRRLFVDEGAQVKRGQALAEIGQAPNGAYLLHFEIRRHGTAVDPVLYLPVRKQPR
ncbi:peptidoglycan DD-metalloendopeptidase family protein [Marichromatium bheemlicum]|uniref:peptidoglycan DD-metalloendopeptidase family protein n=1 Tax=Marichromatium bheemlicum TaxID=365339 RepID=UPI0031B5A27F